jgi:6-phosphofructokinase 1
MAKLKGNAVVGQSGGPTCVINQSLVGVITECRKHREITGLLGAVEGVRGILNENFYDLLRERAATLEDVAQTPSAALRSVRKKPTAQECARIFEIFRKYEVRYFFYIGGNDSAETAHIISEMAVKSSYDLRVFHVPKTIDNDLLVTDHCPGYGSAARFVACAVAGDGLDNESLQGIKIDVIMGRNAGFLTAAARLGRSGPDSAPHLIYVPERPFEMRKFLADVERVNSRLGRCLVAVSEGIVDAGGKPVYQSKERDSHGNVQLSGSGALGDFLSGEIKANLGEKLRVRADTFGYLQRCFPGAASEVDAKEARQVGMLAVKFACKDNGSGSVAMRRKPLRKYAIEYFQTPLASVARNTRRLPDEFIAPEANDITEAFVEYAMPLVGKMPVVKRLAGIKVKPRA